jgi:glycosyltransferase involved in cell wall biosynthesis
MGYVVSVVAEVVVSRGPSVKVLALTRYGRAGASSRMRFMQFVPYLEQQGVFVDVAPLLRDSYLNRLYSGEGRVLTEIAVDYLRRISQLFKVRQYDLLWIEKELFPDLPSWVETWLKRLGIRYVVDFDDAIFHNYDLSNNPLRRCLSRKIDSVMYSASVVVCGNRYLAERALSVGSRAVEILPTVVDLDRYSVRPTESQPFVTIGWIGSPATAKYISLVAPSLRLLAKEFPLKLCVVGANPEVEGVEVISRQWSEKSEVGDIQSFDIGIMPLEDSPWERGKCAYKLIQYMACGVPVVGSPIGVNESIVEHDRSGYLAHNTEEWISALRNLANSPLRRQQFGARGRSLVEQHYCLQVAAPRLLALFKDALG